jgi:hypothetical protein
MFEFDEDGYAEVHLRSDRALLTMRKILDQLEAGAVPAQKQAVG